MTSLRTKLTGLILDNTMVMYGDEMASGQIGTGMAYAGTDLAGMKLHQ